MYYIKKQNGFALLFVLFVVVIFLGFSGVFVSASLNNSKQEATVDMKNQSVIAAEMGIKYNMQLLNNEVRNVDQAYKNFMQTQLDLLANRVTSISTVNNLTRLPTGNSSLACISKFSYAKLDEWIDCEVIEIEIKGLDFYRTTFISRYSNLSTEIKIIDPKTNFQLIKTMNTQMSNPPTSTLEIPFAVKGKRNSSEKVLNGKIIIKIPKYTSVSNDRILSSKLNENDASSRVLLPPNNNEKICALLASSQSPETCKYTGAQLESYLSNIQNASKTRIKVDNLCTAVQVQTNCNLNGLNGSNGILYVSPFNKYLKADNMNSMKNITIYLDGTLDISNSNSANNVKIISRTFITHVSMKLVDSTILVMGDALKSGYIKWNGDSINVSDNSKLCVNLNGIDLTKSSTLNASILSKDGQLIMYPSRIDPSLPVAVPDKIIYMSDYYAFLDRCGVETVELPIDRSMKALVEGQTFIEEIVNY